MSYLKGDIEDVDHRIGVVFKDADYCFLSAPEACCVRQLLCLQMLTSNESSPTCAHVTCASLGALFKEIHEG